MKVIALAVIVALSGCATQPPSHGIPNFGIVAGVAHGGDPTPEGWVWLKGNGYTNIINMAPECSDATPRSLGLNVQDYYISTWQQIAGPVRAQIVWASTDIVPGSSFVHCLHGKNRTMDVMGHFLMTRRNWDKRPTQSLMDSYGWRDSLPALRVFWWLDPQI